MGLLSLESSLVGTPRDVCICVLLEQRCLFFRPTHSKYCQRELRSLRLYLQMVFETDIHVLIYVRE